MEIVVFAAVLALAVVCERRGDARCRATLETWAVEEGYELLSSERRWIGLPFFFRGRSQRVYAIEVRDHELRIREGVAKVGGVFLGSLSDDVAVRWDW